MAILSCRIRLWWECLAGAYAATVTASNATTILSVVVQVAVASAPPPPPPTISSFSPASAARSAAATISGSGLATTSAVSFDGVPASSFAVIDDATLSAVVPASALNGPIAVTTAGGTASSAPFTVLTQHQCSLSINLPALASGQAYWVQLSARGGWHLHLQFFKSGKAIEASAGTICYTSDGAPCPSAAALPVLP